MLNLFILRTLYSVTATSGFTTYAAVDTSPQTTGMSTYPPPDDVSEDEHLTEESAATRTGTIWQKQGYVHVFVPQSIAV